MKFNKKRFMNNVYYLAKREGLKLKTIENNLGLSSGYLTRLNQKGSKTVPSIEVLVSLSNLFAISMDLLVSCNLEELSATEQYLYTFIEKLIKGTYDDKYRWKKEFAKDLLDSQTDNNHPLITKSSPQNIYKSLFRPNDNGLSLFGAQYSVQIDNSTYLYLMDTSFEVEKNDNKTITAGELELYMSKKDLVKGICRSVFGEKSAVNEAIYRLLRSAEESTQRVRIDSDVKEVMDLVLSGTSEQNHFEAEVNAIGPSIFTYKTKNNMQD